MIGTSVKSFSNRINKIDVNNTALSTDLIRTLKKENDSNSKIFENQMTYNLSSKSSASNKSSKSPKINHAIVENTNISKYNKMGEPEIKNAHIDRIPPKKPSHVISDDGHKDKKGPIDRKNVPQKKTPTSSFSGHPGQIPGGEEGVSKTTPRNDLEHVLKGMNIYVFTLYMYVYI
jgi:5'-3' exonuclease